MTTETTPNRDNLDQRYTMINSGSLSGIYRLFSGIYGTMTLGAAIYFIRHASTSWEGVIGIGKAIVWPGLLIYKLFESLKM